MDIFAVVYFCEFLLLAKGLQYLVSNLLHSDKFYTSLFIKFVSFSLVLLKKKKKTVYNFLILRLYFTEGS